MKAMNGGLLRIIKFLTILYIVVVKMFYNFQGLFNDSKSIMRCACKEFKVIKENQVFDVMGMLITTYLV